MDGTPIHPRTIQSLASRGEIEPAGTDLLGDRVTCYQLPHTRAARWGGFFMEAV